MAVGVFWHTDLVQQLQSQRFVFGQPLTVPSSLEAQMLHLSLQRRHLLLWNKDAQPGVRLKNLLMVEQEEAFTQADLSNLPSRRL